MWRKIFAVYLLLRRLFWGAIVSFCNWLLKK
jgi:hypothetical protein